mgnify:CR=1 FL=1
MPSTKNRIIHNMENLKTEFIMETDLQVPKNRIINENMIQDIANEIGKRISLPVQLIPFKTAGATVDAVKTGPRIP